MLSICDKARRRQNERIAPAVVDPHAWMGGRSRRCRVGAFSRASDRPSTGHVHPGWPSCLDAFEYRLTNYLWKAAGDDCRGLTDGRTDGHRKTTALVASCLDGAADNEMMTSDARISLNKRTLFALDIDARSLCRPGPVSCIRHCFEHAGPPCQSSHST